MVNKSPESNTEKISRLAPLNMNEVRAHFILRGTTIKEFALRHGFNPTAAHRAILAHRHGPKHRRIRRLIEKEME